MHLVTYTKVTIEVVTKYSEPRIKEIFPASDQEEARKKKGTLGKEHCPERAHQYGTTPDPKKEEGVDRATDSKPNHKATTSENSLQANDTDNKEDIEVLKDNERHTSNTSNIRKAFQTVASALWPRTTKKNENKTSKKKLKKKKGLGLFLSKIKTKHQNP